MPHHFQCSQSVRAMHTTLRRWKLEVQVLVRAPVIQCGAVVPTASQPAAKMAAPHSSPVFVADLERHLSCKQAHVGANPTEGSISNTLHVVTVSIPRCERGGAGATPAVGTISSSCARQRAEPAVCNTALPSASLGRTSTFHRIRESQQHSLALEARGARGSTGVSDHFMGL